MPLRAALLDLGNVLWDDEANDAFTFYRMREMLKAHGLELEDSEVADAVDEAVREWAPSVDDHLLAKFAPRAGLDLVHARAEWALVFAPEQDKLLGRTFLFSDVAASLARLKAAGLKLAVATNYGPSAKVRLGALGVGGLIDVWGLAPEIGAPKPEPLFFERVLGRLAVAPSEAVMVGDRQDNDIAPAKRCGLGRCAFCTASTRSSGKGARRRPPISPRARLPRQPTGSSSAREVIASPWPRDPA